MFVPFRYTALGCCNVAIDSDSVIETLYWHFGSNEIEQFGMWEAVVGESFRLICLAVGEAVEVGE